MMESTLFVRSWAMIAALLSGGGGLPVSLPPGEVDSALDQLAPADHPLFFISLSGTLAPAADSKNRTEQLLAEPEVQHFLRDVQQVGRGLVTRMARTEGDRVAARLAPTIVKTLLTRPTMVYASEIDLQQQRPDIRGAMAINLGPMKGEWTRVLSLISNEVAKPIQINGDPFQQLEVHPNAPTVTYGIRGDYFYLAIGVEEMETLLARTERKAPDWLTLLRGRFDVPRIATIVQIDPSRIRIGFGNGSGSDGPNGTLIKAMGLDNLNRYTIVTGLGDQGAVQFSAFDFDGPLQGVLAASGTEPLKAADLTPIPRDSLIAIAARLDGAKMIRTIAQSLPPNVRNELLNGASIERRLGVSVPELTDAIGDVWTLHTADADGGLVSGWLGTVTIRDHDKLEMLLRGLEKSLPQVRIQRSEFLGETLQIVAIPGPVPVAPTICLTKERMVVGLFPQAIKSYLSRRERREPTLADLPLVSQALAQNPTTISASDNNKLLRMFYPVVQMGARMALAEAKQEGVFVDDALLPSATSVVRHFGVGVTISQRTETGFVVQQRQTLPSGSFTAVTPIAAAMLLPALANARTEARSMSSTNNMKQIAIAMHNHHDVYNHFPARYQADANGKPLLSWRVYLLPYLDSGALYEQFHLDEPWDSPHNKKLIEQIPASYRSPLSKAQPGMTTYLAIDAKDGILQPPAQDQFGKQHQAGTSMAKIRDGISMTVLIAEVNDEHAVPWTKPDDYQPPANDPGKGLRGVSPRSVHVGMADGSVQRLSLHQATTEFLKAVFTKDGGESINLRQ